MLTQKLNGRWTLNRLSDPPFSIKASVPGSVYMTLINNKIIPDPYKYENQYDAFKISEDDYIYSLNFDISPDILSSEKIYLHFDGIDTVSEVFFNGISIGNTNNMHRGYEFDITDLISRESSQNVTVNITSPLKYIREKNSALPLWGVSSTTEGYPHIRKAHYMFGWDWGPSLPDMGIWKDVYLVGVSGGRIDNFYHKQTHTDEGVYLNISAKISDISGGDHTAFVTISSPKGEDYTAECDISGDKILSEVLIEEPELWYPRGYGSQPLYKVTLSLRKDGKEIDCKEENIGLRLISVSRLPDNDGTDGEEFAFVVNGVKIFAMGANYVPEDQLICRRSRKKTEKLLSDCLCANFNMIRVWGGGYYPDDYFYDFCDKNGILVWQDMMFACAVYSADRAFCENIKQEIIKNVKRIRNHPSLAIWCGNNEIESAWQYWGLPDNPELKKGYLRMFEALIPKILDYYDPVTYYHPSSPSSGGNFNDSGAKNKGDIHFWEVWHSLKPIDDYSKYLFRFCSEYGFESIPDMKTVLSFADKKDLNLNSPVMTAHQKCDAGNEKLLYYIGSYVHYPYTFEGLIYASQLIQAEAVKICAEHMRRHRGICMGSLYWQLNDSNPVISWSSIDYFGRWKALHYYAKRFYAPILLSAELTEENKISVYLSSEQVKHTDGKIIWKIRKNTGEVIAYGEKDVIAEPLSAINAVTVDLEEEIPPELLHDRNFKREHCLDYSFRHKGAVLSSSVMLFVRPAMFRFVDPKLRFEVAPAGNKFKITVSSEAFAKGVRLGLKNYDAVFSDNWFDLCSDEKLVFLNTSELPNNFTAEILRNELTVTSYYEAEELYRYEEKSEE